MFIHWDTNRPGDRIGIRPLGRWSSRRPLRIGRRKPTKGQTWVVLTTFNRPARPDGVLFDLLMAVMNSLETWSASAPDPALGPAWRNAVTVRMAVSRSYAPYEEMVADAAAEIGLPSEAPGELFDQWSDMQPWPDAAALSHLALPYGFVTNCSTELARLAAGRSGLTPLGGTSRRAGGARRRIPQRRIQHPRPGRPS